MDGSKSPGSQSLNEEAPGPISRQARARTMHTLSVHIAMVRRGAGEISLNPGGTLTSRGGVIVTSHPIPGSVVRIACSALVTK